LNGALEGDPVAIDTTSTPMPYIPHATTSTKRADPANVTGQLHQRARNRGIKTTANAATITGPVTGTVGSTRRIPTTRRKGDGTRRSPPVGPSSPSTRRATT